MMIVNMHSVVEKDSSDISLVCSFKLKSRASAHAKLLNIAPENNYIVVPSEINLCEPVNQLGVE